MWSWAISLSKPGPLPEDEHHHSGTYIISLLPGSQALVHARLFTQHVNNPLVCQLAFLLNPFWYNSSLAFCFLFSLLQSFRKFFPPFLFKNILTQNSSGNANIPITQLQQSPTFCFLVISVSPTHAFSPLDYFKASRTHCIILLVNKEVFFLFCIDLVWHWRLY